MTTTRRHDSYKGPPPKSAWLPILDRGIVLRATIIAAIIGSVLTLINQSGWVRGREPLQFLQLILVFLLPFAVVTIAQVAGVRQARIDDAHGSPASREGFVATAVSHGIPLRAVVIGLIIGSLNAFFVVMDALLRSGDLAVVSVVPLAQAYVLPLLFGLLSQTIAYRRSRFSVAKAGKTLP